MQEVKELHSSQSVEILIDIKYNTTMSMHYLKDIRWSCWWANILRLLILGALITLVVSR